MSFVARLLGTAGATAAKGLLEGVGGLATSIRSAITGELPPAARAKLEELALRADTAFKIGLVLASSCAPDKL